MTEKSRLVGEPWKQKVYKVLNWLSRITLVGRLFSSFSLLHLFFVISVIALPELLGQLDTWLN